MTRRRPPPKVLAVVSRTQVPLTPEDRKRLSTRAAAQKRPMRQQRRRLLDHD